MKMVLFPTNPISVPGPGKDWMEFVTEGETCARIMLTAERMERSAVLMDVKKTVLNLVSHLMPLVLLFKYIEHSVQCIMNKINKQINK